MTCHFQYLKTIVFRPIPVQGPSSRFWPGHWVGRVNFFKSKRRRFSKKKTKVNGLQPGLTGFFPTLFFLQPGPVLAPGRPAGRGRVSKLCLKPMTLQFWIPNINTHGNPDRKMIYFSFLRQIRAATILNHFVLRKRCENNITATTACYSSLSLMKNFMTLRK
jgi:hypothetical protein